MKNKIQLSIDGVSYPFELADNKTTQALSERLPLALEMRDYNQNEKVVALDNSLPTQSKTYQEIQAGDVMLYGSDAIVIFYKTFQSGYSYTRLGRIIGDLSEIDHRENVQLRIKIN